jgi:hypothetical protein
VSSNLDLLETKRNASPITTILRFESASFIRVNNHCLLSLISFFKCRCMQNIGIQLPLYVPSSVWCCIELQNKWSALLCTRKKFCFMPFGATLILLTLLVHFIQLALSHLHNMRAPSLSDLHDNVTSHDRDFSHSYWVQSTPTFYWFNLIRRGGSAVVSIAQLVSLGYHTQTMKVAKSPSNCANFCPSFK